MPGLNFLKKIRSREGHSDHHSGNTSAATSHHHQQHSSGSGAGASGGGAATTTSGGHPAPASSGGAQPTAQAQASSGSATAPTPASTSASASQGQHGQSNPHANDFNQPQSSATTSSTQATAGAPGIRADGTALQPPHLNQPQSANSNGTSNLVNAPQYDGAAHTNSANNLNTLSNAASTLSIPIAPAASVSPGTDPNLLHQQQQAARPPPPAQEAGSNDAMQTDHTVQQPQQQQHLGQHGQYQQQHHHQTINQPAQQQPHPGHQHNSSVSSTARVTKGKYTLTDFDILRTLGTGSFGRVHLVQSKHNQRFYAIKVLKKAQVVKMKQVEHTNDERRMLSDVKHPFLITLWGTFADWKNLYMVMDFVEGGELFSLLRKSGRFPNPVAKFYAAEVTLALEYMHSKNIIYRDLKPENLLLDRHGHLKITDFGFAKRVPDKTWTLCGTPDYLAPEVVSNKGYNKSVDWWSLGILIYEMLCGYTPFWDSGSPMRIYENILKGKVKYPAYIVPEAQDLLQKLITADLTKRLGNLYGGPLDVKNHPWFSEVTWDRLARKDIDAPYTPPVKAGAGDASQFDKYPEEAEKYGQSGGPDDFGHLFTEF